MKDLINVLDTWKDGASDHMTPGAVDKIVSCFGSCPGLALTALDCARAVACSIPEKCADATVISRYRVDVMYAAAQGIVYTFPSALNATIAQRAIDVMCEIASRVSCVVLEQYCRLRADTFAYCAAKYSPDSTIAFRCITKLRELLDSDTIGIVLTDDIVSCPNTCAHLLDIMRSSKDARMHEEIARCLRRVCFLMPVTLDGLLELDPANKAAYKAFTKKHVARKVLDTLRADTMENATAMEENIPLQTFVSKKAKTTQ